MNLFLEKQEVSKKLKEAEKKQKAWKRKKNIKEHYRNNFRGRWATFKGQRAWTTQNYDNSAIETEQRLAINSRVGKHQDNKAGD